MTKHAVVLLHLGMKGIFITGVCHKLRLYSICGVSICVSKEEAVISTNIPLLRDRGKMTCVHWRPTIKAFSTVCPGDDFHCSLQINKIGYLRGFEHRVVYIKFPQQQKTDCFRCIWAVFRWAYLTMATLTSTPVRQSHEARVNAALMIEL